MTLDRARKGQVLKIVDIPDAGVRAQAIRFGIGEGETVVCAQTLPAGPVIIRRSAQEIAVGRGLAAKIIVDSD